MRPINHSSPTAPPHAKGKTLHSKPLMPGIANKDTVVLATITSFYLMVLSSRGAKSHPSVHTAKGTTKQASAFVISEGWTSTARIKISERRNNGTKEALRVLVAEICNRYPITSIGGHRDYSPELNGNGMIEPHEWVKACPCFEVKAEFKHFGVG